MKIKIAHWELYQPGIDERSRYVSAGPCRYVKLKVKPQGKKYKRIMRQDRYAYGTFIVLLQAWGQQDRNKREGGLIWTWASELPEIAEEIADDVHYNAEDIKKHLPLLIEMGWIQLVEKEAALPKESKVAKPKELPQSTIPAGVQTIFDYWNSDSLVWVDDTKKEPCRCPQTGQAWPVTEKLTYDVVVAIAPHLSKWPIEDLQIAIDNCHFALTSPDHPGWTHIYSLSEFFGRFVPGSKTEYAFYKFLSSNYNPHRFEKNQT